MEIGDNFTINEIEVFREMYFISVIDGGLSFIDGVTIKKVKVWKSIIILDSLYNQSNKSYM